MGVSGGINEVVTTGPLVARIYQDREQVSILSPSET